MFDTLTLEGLYQLHEQLCADHDANHQRMIIPGQGPRISVYGDEWAVLSAKQAEINETADAVYAEIKRRQQAEGIGHYA